MAIGHEEKTKKLIQKCNAKKKRKSVCEMQGDGPEDQEGRTEERKEKNT